MNLIKKFFEIFFIMILALCAGAIIFGVWILVCTIWLAMCFFDCITIKETDIIDPNFKKEL